jgi:very-short-patch-repair endonuclease
MSIAHARSLRRRLSPPEARLWNALRTPDLKPWHFRRQVPFGPYYADFASIGAKLIVEVDGSQHFADEPAARDARRDTFLHTKGYRVLRVTASDVLNHLDSVYAAIRAAVSAIP